MKIRCPRDKAALADQQYEGETVAFCPACYGHWMTRDQLDSIVNNVELKFSAKTEKRVFGTLTLTGDESRVVDESPPVSCPECGTEMDRKRYRPNCAVRIDECDTHGVWLDTGEIKDLQVFVEKRILGVSH